MVKSMDQVLIYLDLIPKLQEKSILVNTKMEKEMDKAYYISGMAINTTVNLKKINIMDMGLIFLLMVK